MKLDDAVLAAIYRLPSGLSRRALFMFYYRRLPHVRNPVTFHEKINWRIIKDRREIIAWTCDKLAMKDYAATVQGAINHGVRIPQTLWTGTDVGALSNIELPEHWVLKPNHRSGHVFFGHGRPDIASLERITQSWFQQVEGTVLHEWAYLNARPLLLVEELLGVPGVSPPDYKFYVFDGEVAAIQVHTGRHADHRLRWYLPDWSPLDVASIRLQLSPVEPLPPSNLDKMVAIAGDLGRPFDFMRIDLYNVDGDIFFGELTPYPASGIDRFVPDSFDDELGAKWQLPVTSGR